MIRRFVLAAVAVAFTFAMAYSDTFTARILEVKDGKVKWGTGKFNADTKTFEVDKDSIKTSTAAKDVVVEKAGAKGKKGKGATDPTPIEGGLNADQFKNINADKGGINATITTTEDKGAGNITKITVGGGKGGGKKGA